MASKAPQEIWDLICVYTAGSTQRSLEEIEARNKRALANLRLVSHAAEKSASQFLFRGISLRLDAWGAKRLLYLTDHRYTSVINSVRAKLFLSPPQSQSSDTSSHVPGRVGLPAAFVGFLTDATSAREFELQIKGRLAHKDRCSEIKSYRLLLTPLLLKFQNLTILKLYFHRLIDFDCFTWNDNRPGQPIEDYFETRRVPSALRTLLAGLKELYLWANVRGDLRNSEDVIRCRDLGPVAMHCLLLCAQNVEVLTFSPEADEPLEDVDFEPSPPIIGSGGKLRWLKLYTRLGYECTLNTLRANLQTIQTIEIFQESTLDRPKMAQIASYLRKAPQLTDVGHWLMTWLWLGQPAQRGNRSVDQDMVSFMKAMKLRRSRCSLPQLPAGWPPANDDDAGDEWPRILDAYSKA